MKHRGSLLASFLVAVVVAACGGSGSTGTTSVSESGQGNETTTTAVTQSSTGASADLPDPCALLTPADLEESTGFVFLDGEPSATRTNSIEAVCEWQTAETTDHFGVVQLVASTLNYEIMMDAASTVYDVGDVEIAGADRAFADVSGSPVGADVAGLFLQVTYTGSDQDMIAPATAALAEVAISNLEG
jgi:hypothetical protein